MTHISQRSPDIYPLGESAITLQAPEPVDIRQQQKIWSLAHQLKTQPYVIDVVPGMNNLTVSFHRALTSYAQIHDWLETAWQEEASSFTPGRMHTIPVHYGQQYGPDIMLVAKHCGMTIQEVIQHHTEAVYTVFFIGFQPGFAYLGGMPECLATPRHTTPRTVIPAGSVAIGGRQTGVYPNDSPGGWQIIGHTDIILFDAAREPASLWQPGDQVTFVALDCADN